MGKITLTELLSNYADDTIVFVDSHSLFDTEYHALVYLTDEFTKATVPFELQNLTVIKYYDDEDILTVYLEPDTNDESDAEYVRHSYFGIGHV